MEGSAFALAWLPKAQGCPAWTRPFTESGASNSRVTCSLEQLTPQEEEQTGEEGEKKGGQLEKGGWLCSDQRLVGN